jgi:adenylate cyclase
VERKLTAILCADVHGYSRLMGDDEEATFRTLASHRETIDRLIEQHHGQVVNTAGDSVLAQFASAVNAVQCGIETQLALKTENANLPQDRRMDFRIGVNLGDVIVNGEQIYGDGVNVAARLETLAEPGGICISGTVYEHVRDKLALVYEDAGEHSVKNIARSVRVWRVQLVGAPTRAKTPLTQGKYWRGGVLSLAGFVIIVGTILLVQHLSLRPQPIHASIPTQPKPALSLPSIPSIAVLPFVNLSGDAQQEYFSDGITDDLITDLSRVPKLFVIARSSSFTYKGRPEKVETVGRELGVKYLLEGSARRAGDQVRINVQLVDAATGNEVWSQRYDRQMRDIFKLQDEIVQSLTTTLGLQLSLLEQGVVVPQRTKNLEAYDYYLRGFESSLNPTPEGLAQAQKMFQKSIELDAGYSDAYAALGFIDLVAYAWQSGNDPYLLARAGELANKAIALDESNSGAYAVRGEVGAIGGRRSEALADSERATSLDQNSAVAWVLRADINTLLEEKPEETLMYIQKARRLDPRHPESGCLQEGATLNGLRRNAAAVEALKGCQPNNPWAHVTLVIAYSELGRTREAQAEAAEVLRLSPGFSLAQVQRRLRGINWQDPHHQHFLAAMRKAGLK